MTAPQLSLIDAPGTAAPQGFAYLPAIVSRAEETELIARLHGLPLREFEFRGYLGKRRVVSFGMRYDFADRAVHRVEAIPDYLLPLRDRAAGFAGLPPAALEHALVTEYRPGAAIGWHRDRPAFGDVVGISVAAACRFRFRRKSDARWQRRSIILAPRSAYLLRGVARDDWEHSIPPVEELRYSVTFRTMRSA
ncbi:MAG TPA: alpha-ketoglutarate-dependent dioxygenase AlkB [Stellaceae bacterium]|nr:alpha-ketoglutarate-dependent dioxygenase AlkB [Stellaceae bacterium]